MSHLNAISVTKSQHTSHFYVSDVIWFDLEIPVCFSLLTRFRIFRNWFISQLISEIARYTPIHSPPSEQRV